MLITTFVFIGIEGASVYSRYAKRREDVGRATVIGFLSVLCIFALVTLSSYAVVPQPELAATRQPSMVGCSSRPVRLLRLALALLLGLRLHLIATVHGLPIAWVLTGAKADEREVLDAMLDRLPADLAVRIRSSLSRQTLMADKGLLRQGLRVRPHRWRDRSGTTTASARLSYGR